MRTRYMGYIMEFQRKDQTGQTEEEPGTGTDCSGTVTAGISKIYC